MSDEAVQSLLDKILLKLENNGDLNISDDELDNIIEEALHKLETEHLDVEPLLEHTSDTAQNHVIWPKGQEPSWDEHHHDNEHVLEQTAWHDPLPVQATASFENSTVKEPGSGSSASEAAPSKASSDAILPGLAIGNTTSVAVQQLTESVMKQVDDFLNKRLNQAEGILNKGSSAHGGNIFIQPQIVICL